MREAMRDEIGEQRVGCVNATTALLGNATAADPGSVLGGDDDGLDVAAALHRARVDNANVDVRGVTHGLACRRHEAQAGLHGDEHRGRAPATSFAARLRYQGQERREA